MGLEFISDWGKTLQIIRKLENALNADLIIGTWITTLESFWCAWDWISTDQILIIVFKK